MIGALRVSGAVTRARPPRFPCCCSQRALSVIGSVRVKSQQVPLHISTSAFDRYCCSVFDNPKIKTVVVIQDECGK